MASSGVFELTAYTDLAAADVFAAVDVSDSTQSPQGSLKKITAASVFAAAQPITIASGTVTVSTPVFQATQTWNAAGVTFTGIDLNVTSTASAAGSLLANLRIGGTSKWSVDKSGNVVAAGSLTMVGALSTGNVQISGGNLFISNNGGFGILEPSGALVVTFQNAGITISRTTTFSALLTTLASATGSAGFNIPHGVAPTSPVNGDVWSTTSGLFIRINGVTKTVTLT